MTPTGTRARRAARRTPVRSIRRRRGAARHLRALLAGAALATVGAAAVWLAGVMGSSPLLTIDHIAVDGNVRMSRGEVIGLLDALRGQNLFRADLAAGRSTLLSSGWVRDATLRRVLPSTVHVNVTEREPIGLGRFGARLYAVDASGSIVDEIDPRLAELDLPIIDGLSAGPEGADPVVRERRAALATRVIEDIDLESPLGTRLSQVDVANPHDAVVLLSGDPASIHLGEEQFAARLDAYVNLVPVLRHHVPHIDSVDMRFERLVYVNPAAGEPAGRGGGVRRAGG